MPVQSHLIRLPVLILALIAGIGLSQTTPLLAGTSLSRRICLHSLQVCNGCPEQAVALPAADSCCEPGGDCATEPTSIPAQPAENEPADQPAESDCGCCTLITLTTPLLSISTEPHQLFSVLCIEDALIPSIRHAQGWVDSLLRPPSI